MPDQVCWPFPLIPLHGFPGSSCSLYPSESSPPRCADECEFPMTVLLRLIYSLGSRRHFSHIFCHKLRRWAAFTWELCSAFISVMDVFFLFDDQVCCLSDYRSRKLGSTLTRSLSMQRGLRNSTVSFCLHQFQNQVSVYLEMNHRAMTLGIGAEPILFFLSSVNSRAAYICVIFHQCTHHSISHPPLPYLGSPCPATVSSSLHGSETPLLPNWLLMTNSDSSCF